MPTKKNFTREMIDDIPNLSLYEFVEKWNISAPTIIKMKRQLNIDGKFLKDGLKPHKFLDGIEYKECGHCKDLFTLDKFYKCTSKPDGLMSLCKTCQSIKCKESNSKISNKFTDDMLSDLEKIGDQEFSRKWNVSRKFIIKERKVRDIKPFNNQYGIIEHRIIDNKEYKWCSKGHWDLIDNFGKHIKNYDSLRNWCKDHERVESKKYYKKNNGAEKAREWRKTDVGKTSLRIINRKQRTKRLGLFVFWNKDVEQTMYDIFGKNCSWCGISEEEHIEIYNKRFDIEHFVSISNNGLTVPGNLYPCCISCNRGDGGKFTRDALEWALEKFGDERGNLLYNNIVLKLVEHYNLYKQDILSIGSDQTP